MLPIKVYAKKLLHSFIRFIFGLLLWLLAKKPTSANVSNLMGFLQKSSLTIFDWMWPLLPNKIPPFPLFKVFLAERIHF